MARKKNDKKSVMEEQPALLMDLTQMKAYLGISDKMARELVKEPDFPALLLHGKYMIFRDELPVWLKERYSVGKQRAKAEEESV